MLEMLMGLGSASLTAYWVPVFVWTGLAGAMLLVLAAARGLHPLAGYRLRQGMLLALPASVLLAPWLPVPALMSQTLATVLEGSAGAAPPDLAAPIQMGTAQINAIEVFLGLATIVVALLALVRLSSLARDLHHLHRLRVAAGLLFLVTTTLAACVGRTEGPDSSVAATATGSSSAVSRTLEATQASLRRLEIELSYLRERMDELRAQEDAIPRTRPELPPQGEDYERYSDLVQHQLLLNEMFQERLRQFETLRMNQETLRRLQEGDPETTGGAVIR